MMGAGVNTSEIFEKLESMRTVVTEVNTQFKNPVRLPPSSHRADNPVGPHDLYPCHECVAHPAPSTLTRSSLRVPFPLRDGASDPRAHDIPNRRARHLCEPAAVPRYDDQLQALQNSVDAATEVSQGGVRAIRRGESLPVSRSVD